RPCCERTSPDLARERAAQRRGTEFHADRQGCLRRPLGSLVSPGKASGVRTVAVLVRALLSAPRFERDARGRRTAASLFWGRHPPRTTRQNASPGAQGRPWCTGTALLPRAGVKGTPGSAPLLIRTAGNPCATSWEMRSGCLTPYSEIRSPTDGSFVQ